MQFHLNFPVCRYEKQGKARRTIPAQKLWFAVLEAQIETGTPYMLYKDSCNRKSNQQNLGTIKSSNLCTEIIEYTSPDEVQMVVIGCLPTYIYHFTYTNVWTGLELPRIDTYVCMVQWSRRIKRRLLYSYTKLSLGLCT